MELIYDLLLEKDDNGLIFWLVKEWEVSEDGKIFIFILVDGVKWYDGKDLIVEDVVFIVEYFKKYLLVRGGFMLNGEYLMDIVFVDGNKVIIYIVDYILVVFEKIGSMRIILKYIWEKVDDLEKFLGEGDIVGLGLYKLVVYNLE